MKLLIQQVTRRSSKMRNLMLISHCTLRRRLVHCVSKFWMHPSDDMPSVLMYCVWLMHLTCAGSASSTSHKPQNCKHIIHSVHLDILRTMLTSGHHFFTSSSVSCKTVFERRVLPICCSTQLVCLTYHQSQWSQHQGIFLSCGKLAQDTLEPLFTIPQITWPACCNVVSWLVSWMSSLLMMMSIFGDLW